jgi:plasmid stabilization system protein ParE
MTRLSSIASRQYLDLIDHYLARGYDEAAEKLTEALEQAVIAIVADPMAGLDYPAIYDKPDLARCEVDQDPSILVQLHHPG